MGDTGSLCGFKDLLFYPGVLEFCCPPGARLLFRSAAAARAGEGAEPGPPAGLGSTLASSADREAGTEVPAVIPEAEAKSIARALWEANVERGVQAVIDAPRGSASEQVFIGKLNKLSREVRAELAEGASLQICREELNAAGKDWKLDNGVFVFVHPAQYDNAMVALREKRLFPDQVVFAESLEYLVAEALDRCRTWMRSQEGLSLPANDTARHGIPAASSSTAGSSSCHAQAGDYDVPWAPHVVIERTFLCLAPAVRAVSSAVTVSSTDARKPQANPRRKTVQEE